MNFLGQEINNEQFQPVQKATLSSISTIFASVGAVLLAAGDYVRGGIFLGAAVLVIVTRELLKSVE